MCYQKSYWGIGGSGFVFVCPDDSTVFLQKRSNLVSGGKLQYGFPGGGIHIGKEKFWETPIKKELVLDDLDPVFLEVGKEEVSEECGSVPTFSILDTFLYEDCGFKYKTFIATMSLAEKRHWKPFPDPGSGWEIYKNPDGSYEQKWVDIDQFPRMNLFFGFTPQLIGKIIAAT